MTQIAVEFHDSTVFGIAEVGTQIIVFLRAYLHQSEGRPAWDAGSGSVQAAVMTFSEATIEGELPEFPSDIWKGDMEIKGETLSNILPVPFHETGDIVLKMRFVFDTPAEIVIIGKQALLTLIGDPVYVEEFSSREFVA